MTSARSSAPETPSSPNPMRIESWVVIEEPTGKPAASVRIQLFALGPLPGGGPVTSHPPKSVSNEVLVPSGKVTSSTNAPRFCTDQSLAYAIETSTVSPDQSDRSTDHSCQPPELPELACHSPPPVPVGEQVPAPTSSVW